MKTDLDLYQEYSALHNLPVCKGMRKFVEGTLDFRLWALGKRVNNVGVEMKKAVEAALKGLV